jgi:hypothetical protein
MSMTLELLRPVVSKRNRKTKAIIVIGGIVLSSIIGISIVVAALSTGLPHSDSSTKRAICTGKVLELAQKGIIRDVGGYYGAIYECTHMHGLSSVYGQASS